MRPVVLYHFMNLVSGSVSIAGGLIWQALPDGPATSKKMVSLRCISPCVLSGSPLVWGRDALASMCRMPRIYKRFSNSDTPLLFFSDLVAWNGDP